jgi:hypothetical protein
MSKSNVAWTKILDGEFGKRLQSEGYADIQASDIKQVTGEEARLMTKFDAREKLPKAIRNTTILPTRNGRYRVIKGDGYQNVKAAPTRQYWPAGAELRRLQTLNFIPQSEGQAITIATTSRLLQDFLEEDELHQTITGRRRSPKFDFTFRAQGGQDIPIEVEGVQVEVDGGFEGDSVHLLEAKMGAWDNFHIRQLYYPYRMWSSQVSKPVRASFLAYVDRTFRLRTYDFNPTNQFQSASVVKAVDYILDDE